MKKILYYLLLAFVIACSNSSDDLIIEDKLVNPTEDASDNTTPDNTDNTPDDGGNPGEEDDSPIAEPIIIPTPIADEDRIQTPCDFDFSTVTPGETIAIDCLINLQGRIVNFPPNITLDFEGGDLVNGTINFASNGRIDSELLNSSLQINGEVQLRENNFLFKPSRWEIVEGNATLNDAFNNHVNIQKAVDLVKKLTPQPSFDRTNFNIERLDAYFESNRDAIGIPVILVPSNFNLNMTNETILRVFSVNNNFTSRVIRLVGVINITIRGGTIIGDRRERTVNRVGNVLVGITGGQNVVVDGVTMNFGSITGLTVNSIGRLGNPIDDGTEYFPSRDVIIRNCVFDSNRSNNLSITDGENITVTNCRLYRAGVDIGSSRGAAPKLGVVVEPVQGQQVNGVRITGNFVEESAGNSILAAFGNDIFISGNTTQKGVGWNGASNVVIVDNPSLGGVLAGDDNGFNLSQSTGNIVRGNTIRNAATGILASNDDILIENNNLIDCRVGMQLRNLRDSRVANNTIVSSVPNSFGINTQITVDNVIVEGNEIRIQSGRPFSIGGINNDDRSKLMTVRNNRFNCGSQGRIEFSSGVVVSNNTFERSGFGITNGSNIVIDENTIATNQRDQHSFFINNTSAINDITVTNNTISNTINNVAGIRLVTIGEANVLANTARNVVIRNNTINVAGFGINSVNYNNVTIENNNIDIEDSCCNAAIFFRGANSSLIGNRQRSGAPLARTDIEGSNIRL